MKKNSNPCEQCQEKKRGCDGVKPTCGPCQRARNKQTCSYSLGRKAIDGVASYSLKVDEVDGVGSLTIGSFMDRIFVVEGIKNCTNASSTIINDFVIEQKLLQNQPQINPTLELHLFHLGCLNSSFTKFASYIKSSSGNYSITRDLVAAICVYGVFFSTHPLLFPSSEPALTNARISKANDLYPHDRLLDLIETRAFYSMEHVYFTLEALLVRAKAMTELFANPELMYTYIGLANRLVREFEVAHPSTFSFQLPNTPSPQSLSIWPFKVPEKEFRFPLSIMERARRISIVASLFVYDTALKDLNGSLFNFEDHELPATQFGNFVCPWENPYLGLDVKNILQNSVFGVGVEGEIKKDWVYALEVDPLTDALRWAKLANLSRRVVNFKRKSFYMCSDPLSSDLKEQLAIHELILAELSLYDGYTSLHQKIYIYSNLVVLHLPSFSSSEINFRLNFNSHETVTSRTVMFTSVQSLAACISTTKASASIALLNAGRVAVFATVAVKTAIQAYKHQMSTGNGLDYALKTELNVLKRCGRSMVEEYRKLSVWMAAVLYIVLLKMDAAIEL